MIEILTSSPGASADALVVGSGRGGVLATGDEWVAERIDGDIAGFLSGMGFEGKPGDLVTVPSSGPYRSICFVGLGDEPDPETVRRAAGSAGRALSRLRSVATTLHGVGVRGAAGAAAQGFALGRYTFDRHRSEPTPVPPASLALLGGSPADLEEARRSLVVAAGVALARDLINESPVHKSPETLAGIAASIGEETGIRVRVYGEDEIATEGFGGLAGVAAGASNPPRMVEMWYEPPQARGFVVFVGKGIVFDSGGLSLKQPAAMETMKTDMSGAAAVFGALQAIARLELPVRVLGITPLTENMPGGSALRPGDVLRARNGKTIEVLNTDAEGRLVLADGLSLAAEAEPDLIVDVATLTGACRIALGDKIAGLMGTDDAVEVVAAAAADAGERVWRLPIPPDYRSNIDSDVADMKNTGPRYGGAINAAMLLREFVGSCSWAHLDIAGPARADEAESYVGKGGTGFGVRTLVAVAERTASA